MSNQPMDDFFARIRLSAYLDGELTDAEMAEVARALEEQPELRAAYGELRAAVELVRRHGPVQAPARLHAAVMREVEAEPRARRWFARLVAPLGRFPGQALGIALVAAAVLLVVLQGPMEGQPEPAPPPAPEPERAAAAPAGGPDVAPGAAEAPAEAPAEQVQAAPADLTKGDLGPDAKIGAGGYGAAGTKSASVRPKDASAVPIEDLGARKGGATYVPEWDKEQEAAPAGAASGTEARAAADAEAALFSFRLTPSSPDVLRRLVALAEKLDGRALDAQGQPLDPYLLTIERNHARVVLVLPASGLENLETYLKSLGGLVTVVADQERLYREDAVRVEVEVLYEP